jgi:hypothetical protein
MNTQTNKLREEIEQFYEDASDKWFSSVIEFDKSLIQKYETVIRELDKSLARWY